MENISLIIGKVNETKQQFTWYERYIRHQQLSSLNDLPFMTEQLLENYYQQQLNDPSLSVYKTSGTSSGIRKNIYYSLEDDQYYINTKANIFSQFIKNEPVSTVIADMGTGHAAHTAIQVFQKMGLTASSISFQSPIKIHVQTLKERKPDLLYTMPSILDHILLASDNPLEYGIKKIILVGEIASKRWIERVANILGIKTTDIMDTYGSIELGTIAYYSHKHQRYLLVDDLIAEGVQAHRVGLDMEELGPNESILVLTSIHRKLFPAVRWVTYDVVRDLRKISIDGVERASFESIVKRVGHELKHGEKISIYDLEEVIYQHVKEAGFRVEIKQNKLKIYIFSPEMTEKKKIGIQKEIMEKIPEIGRMVNNQILDEIVVERVTTLEDLYKGSVKNKKIYFSPSMEGEQN